MNMTLLIPGIQNNIAHRTGHWKGRQLTSSDSAIIAFDSINARISRAFTKVAYSDCIILE
jgi:hypothetical protein